jgi:hypothetical protein
MTPRVFPSTARRKPLWNKASGFDVGQCVDERHAILVAEVESTPQDAFQG